MLKTDWASRLINRLTGKGKILADNFTVGIPAALLAGEYAPLAA